MGTHGVENVSFVCDCRHLGLKLSLQVKSRMDVIAHTEVRSHSGAALKKWRYFRFSHVRKQLRKKQLFDI